MNVSAIVLANLCVSYIMTAQNEEAEELMRKLEKEEDKLVYEDPNKKVFHLCIVNLVIGYVRSRAPGWGKCHFLKLYLYSRFFYLERYTALKEITILEFHA